MVYFIMCKILLVERFCENFIIFTNGALLFPAAKVYWSAEHNFGKVQ